MKKKIISLMLSALFVTSLSGSVVFADEVSINSEVRSEYGEVNYDFKDTPQEVIDEMKKNLEVSKLGVESYSVNERSLSSMMAKALDTAGFNHSANLLNYSMLSLREEPYRFTRTSILSSDIWTYSPEFKKVVVSFLNEAKSKKSYSYFKTTTMNFEMPSASKVQILADTGLKKRTDLFGALHTVTINLGIVKNGIQWDMLVMMQDKYDFEEAQYNGLVNVVTNIAYHDQERGNIKPYNILITADKPYLTTPPFNVGAW